MNDTSLFLVTFDCLILYFSEDLAVFVIHLNIFLSAKFFDLKNHMSEKKFSFLLCNQKRNSKVSRAPCCHKCWNKCPPYLARRYLADSTVFQDKDIRRYIKEEVWSFLSEDVQVQP